MTSEQRRLLFPTFVSSVEIQEGGPKQGLVGFQKKCLRGSGEWAGGWNSR